MKSSATKIDEAWVRLTEALAPFCTQNSECPLHDALHDFDIVLRAEVRILRDAAAVDDREFDQGHNEAVDSIAAIIPTYGERHADLLSAVKGMRRPLPAKRTPSRCDEAFDRGAVVEREACAALVETWDPGSGFLGQAVRLNVAAAIRARGNA